MQTEECVFVWCNPESAMLSSPSGTSIAAPSLFEGDNSSGEGCNEAPLLNSSVNARSTPGSAEGIVDSTALPPIQTLCPPPLVPPVIEVPHVQAYSHVSNWFPPDSPAENFLILSSPVGTMSGDGVVVLDLQQCYQQQLQQLQYQEQLCRVRHYQQQLQQQLQQLQQLQCQEEQQCQARQYQEHMQEESTIPSQLSPSSSLPGQASTALSEQGINDYVSILESERFANAAKRKLPAADYDILFFEFLNNTEVRARFYRETHLQPKTLTELLGKMYFLHVEQKARKPPKVGFPFRCYTDSHYTSCDRHSPVICKVKEWPSPTEIGKVWRLYHFYCGKVRKKRARQSGHSSSDDLADEQPHASKRHCTTGSSEKVSTTPPPSPATLTATQTSKERPPPSPQSPSPPSPSPPSLDQSETHP
jgi:hypothetical protein